MRIVTALLGPLLTFAAAQAFADPVDTANRLRAEGCQNQPGIDADLRPDRKLNQAAKALARGSSLGDALSGAGYRARASASLHMTGDRTDDAIARTIAARFCAEITNAAFREIGVYSDRNELWILTAAPFDPPTPRQAQVISRRVLELVNDARGRGGRCGRQSYAPAPPLTLSKTLEQAAAAHSADMARHDTLSHSGTDGSTPAQRAERAGYRWRVVGENVAAGPTTAEEVTQGWLASPNHCSNIMDSRFSEMGLAYVFDPDSKGGIYWTQVFGTPK